MVKLQRWLLVLSLFLILPLLVKAQGSHELVVLPTDGDGYLNNVIMGDTTATGARVDSQRVYVLKRNSFYQVNTSIRNVGYTLTMIAEEGTGYRPIVMAVRNATTAAATNLWQVRGNAVVKDLILSGYREDIPSTIGDMQGYIMNAQTAGWTITIDNCILTNSNGNHIRTDGAPKTVKVTNSVFANMGYLGTSNLGAGKAIDLRAGSIDTLLFRNNTFINFQDRIIRHRSSSASLNNLIFDHNTVVNGMSYHGTFALGWVGEKIQITNNLFIDPFALGSDTDATRQAEFNESGELDPFGKGRMTWIFSVPNDTTQWVISNNYYSISDSGQAFLNRYASVSGFQGEAAPLTWHINSKLGADSATAFIKENIELKEIPLLMTEMMDWYRSPDGGNKTKNTPTPKWDPALHDYHRVGMFYLNDTLDCTYPTSLAAYTGAEGGIPVGDLNWFPEFIGVKENPTFVATDFKLDQNFPNPFNPSTVIRYSIPENAHVTLKIFNLLGQEIATLVNSQQKAATYDVTFDASKLSTGIYFYTVKAGKFSSTKKMMLIK